MANSIIYFSKFSLGMDISIIKITSIWAINLSDSPYFYIYFTIRSMVRYLIVVSLIMVIFTESPSTVKASISKNIQSVNDSIYHYETNSAETSWREQSKQTVEVKIVMDEFGPNVVKITNIKLHLYLDFSNNQYYQMETPNKDLGSIEKEGGWFTYYFTTDIPRTNALFINFVIRSEFIEMMDSGIEYLNQDELIQVGGVGIIDKTVDTQFNTNSRNSSIYPFSIIIGFGLVVYLHQKFNTTKIAKTRNLKQSF